MKYIISKSLILILVLNFFLSACAQNNKNDSKNQTTKDTSNIEKNYIVTFIELGSVKCIPCQQMQGVIKSIQTKYGTQVKTVFYDVWTKEGKPYAEMYKINLIPTQVLMDKDGIEFFRHEGYISEEELVKVMKTKGVKD